MKDFEFVASEVRCNGVGGRAYQQVLNHKASLQEMVDETLSDITRDELFEMVVGTGEGYGLYMGPRFMSNEDIVSRLIGAIGTYAYSKLGDEDLVEMYVGAQLNMMSYDDKLTLIVEAARDCASADHWYEYEKDWS